MGAQIVAEKIALHELLRRGADGHGIGSRQRLEARRNVRGLAHGELLAAAACAHLTHHHRTRVHPNAHGQSDPMLLFHAGGEGLHRLDHRQAGPHGALRVVFVRQRIAKVDQQAIAQVLRNVPVEALDDRGTGGLVGSHHGAVVLRVEVPGQRCRVHQVAEQDGELAAFRLRGDTCDVGHLDRCGRLGSADGWCWDRRCGGRCLSHPDQDSAALVACQVLGFDEFHLEVFEVGIVQLKPALQGAIGEPALALEEGNSLREHVLEFHPRPSACMCRVSRAWLRCSVRSDEGNGSMTQNARKGYRQGVDPQRLQRRKLRGLSAAASVPDVAEQPAMLLPTQQGVAGG